MGDWIHIQAQPGEQLMQLHHFSIVKLQPGGDVTFALWSRNSPCRRPASACAFTPNPTSPLIRRPLPSFHAAGDLHFFPHSAIVSG